MSSANERSCKTCRNRYQEYDNDRDRRYEVCDHHTMGGTIHIPTNMSGLSCSNWSDADTVYVGEPKVYRFDIDARMASSLVRYSIAWWHYMMRTALIPEFDQHKHFEIVVNVPKSIKQKQYQNMREAIDSLHLVNLHNCKTMMATDRSAHLMTFREMLP